MSASVDNGSDGRAPGASRPPPMNMQRVQMDLPSPKHTDNSPLSPRTGKPSPDIYARQSTLNNSMNEGSDSMEGLAQRSVQYHYEVPNLSSMLYEFTNRETDRVKQSFRTGNYHSLRDLPRHLLPGNVSQWSRSKIESNLYSHIEERSYIELQNGGGFFSKFSYQANPFEDHLDKLAEERKAAR